MIHLKVNHFARLLVATEKGLKDLFCILSIPVASLEFALSVKTLFKCFIAMLVEEGTFDRVAQNFEGLGEHIKMMGSDLWILFGCFGMVAEC